MLFENAFLKQNISITKRMRWLEWKWILFFKKISGACIECRVGTYENFLRLHKRQIVMSRKQASRLFLPYSCTAVINPHLVHLLPQTWRSKKPRICRVPPSWECNCCVITTYIIYSSCCNLQCKSRKARWESCSISNNTQLEILLEARKKVSIVSLLRCHNLSPLWGNFQS